MQQNPYTDPSLMESDADKSFSQTTLMQTSQRRAGQNDAAIEQREREINDIAKGIIELSDIFRELQNMVIDQGTMLDRIDYNVERMGTEVKSADKELNVVWFQHPSLWRRKEDQQADYLLKATGYQRRTTKRKILLLLVILVVGMIIVLLVKPKRSSSEQTPAPPPPPSSNNMLFPRHQGVDNDDDGLFYYRWRQHPALARITRDKKWIDPDIVYR